MAAVKRRIITHHLVRRTAIAKQHRLKRLQNEADEGNLGAGDELLSLNINPEDELLVGKSERMRSRWIVYVPIA